MADETKPQTRTRTAADVPVTGADIAAVIEAVRSTAPPQKVAYGQRKTRSPFNPTGAKRKPLSRIVYQNGHRVNIKMLFDEEIKLLELLTPGRYINRLVTVRLEEGTNGQPDEIRIDYANRTVDQRMALGSEVRSFVGMLRRCIDEAKGQAVA